MAYAKLAVNK